MKENFSINLEGIVRGSFYWEGVLRVVLEPVSCRLAIKTDEMLLVLMQRGHICSFISSLSIVRDQVVEASVVRAPASLPITAVLALALERLWSNRGLAINPNRHKSPSPHQRGNTYSLSLVSKMGPVDDILETHGANIAVAVPLCHYVKKDLSAHQ